MDMLAELGAVKVPTVPLDVDGLGLPERALLPEWVQDYWRRRKEAQDKAAAERKANANKGR